MMMMYMYVYSVDWPRARQGQGNLANVAEKSVQKQARDSAG